MHHLFDRTAALRDREWIPITVTRIAIGVFFCITGGTKLFEASQREVMVQTMISSHIPFPRFSAIFTALVEFLGGAGLIIGVLTPLCAAILAVDMVVAIATNRIQSIQVHGVLDWIDDFLYLPEVLYVLILVWLIFAGPGRFSVDGLMTGRSRRIATEH